MAKGMSKLQTVVFDKDVVANGIPIKLDWEKFPTNGRVVSIDLRFYAGEENALLIQPVLVDAQGYEDQLIQTVGDKIKGFVSGEDDLMHISCDTPFQKGDMLRVWGVNNSTALENNTYPIKVTIAYYFEGVQ